MRYEALLYQDLHRKLPDFSRGKLLVVGDVMLDSYWQGRTSRISPEAPVPVVQIGEEEARVGGAGNVAVNATTLGATATLMGLVGCDSTADQLESLLRRNGVNSSLHRVPSGRTITKLRVLSRHQQLIRLDFEDQFSASDAEALGRDFAQRLGNADVVILSDYAKGTLRHCHSLVEAARKAGKRVVIDPKGTDFERYRGATILTPNLSEFEAVAGSCGSEEDLERRGNDLCEGLDLEALLITRSEKGMTLITRGRPPLHLPARAKEVFDVTGAGDTVVATLATGLAAGMPMDEAVALSNVAAGIVVGKVGTATVTINEILHAMSVGTNSYVRGAMNEADLFVQVGHARRNGERVVMTNGCFDILHPGHVDYLEKAKGLGDRLIVAVNDDESVRRLKGPSRPVNGLASRMRMLSALACVDWVVSFSEDTPERLISHVLPDTLVKGGDYHPDQIAGAAAVKSAGGRVQVLDFIEGHSTTEIIQRIRTI